MDRVINQTTAGTWLDLGLRLILGISFIWASLHKIAAPAQFADILYGYGIFPGDLINILALWVPYVEFISGVCLLTGGYKLLSGRSGLMVINVMLIVFIMIIGFNLIRGHEFDCGCFSFGDDSGGRSAAVQLLVRDLVLLTFGILLFFRLDPKRKSAHPYHSEA